MALARSASLTPSATMISMTTQRRVASVSPAHRLSRRDARRIAIRAQLLDKSRPTDMLQTIRHLTMLQLDGTSTVAPSADLMLWSRIGSSYSPSKLREAIEKHTLVDLRGMLRPKEDIALYRADMANWPGTGELRPYKKSQARVVRVASDCGISRSASTPRPPPCRPRRLNGRATRSGCARSVSLAYEDRNARSNLATSAMLARPR